MRMFLWHEYGKIRTFVRKKQSAQIMATLTLQIDNPSIMAHLKAVLKAIQGVKVQSSDETLVDDATTDQPNATTLAAMKEAEGSTDAGVVRMDSLQSFMASMD